MKLPLNVDVWTRLYGPYGNRSVNDLIAKLVTRWDPDVAAELFWEELHHQDDIYPSTFAALPWLLGAAPKSGESFEDAYLFFSHVIYCACAKFGASPRGKYRGLSTNISDHHHAWLSEGERLREDDLPTLLKLEEWFSDNVAKMAVDCLNIVDEDLTKAAYALEGFAAFEGSVSVARAAQMFADGEEKKIIEQEMGFFGDTDVRVVTALQPHICHRNEEIMAFLNDFPRHSDTPRNP
ncbi:hypothetical protein BC777_0240 [Yoonia maricola]|uniref:Uncharacterized protein n=1 Tax=Yoonia maricola TaxID=420999 RepID=A0A2M8WKH0_9RHOB|nr:hypothetical protein [Yoonia maricola]PJI91412.1 hypothetical protein BC777_0240 [Yoonia maricola]